MHEKKAQIRAALTEGRAIPTELVDEARRLKSAVDAEDARTQRLATHADDEYASAGTRDPRVCVTTSREPSSRLKEFAKEVRQIFPNAQRVNRGGTRLEDVVAACRAHDFTDIVLLQEHRGEPVGMIVSHLPFGPTAYFTISNCVMRHDIEGVVRSCRAAYSFFASPLPADAPETQCPVSEANPHLIFHDLSSPLGVRVSNVLKHLFPVPRPDSTRVVTFANLDDHISFRHHIYTKSGAEIELREVGPRFELRPYQVKLGTIEQDEAESEWILRAFTNTSRKRKLLTA